MQFLYTAWMCDHLIDLIGLLRFGYIELVWYNHCLDYTLTFFFEFYCIEKKVTVQCFEFKIDEKLHQKKYLVMQTFQMYSYHNEYRKGFETFLWKFSVVVWNLVSEFYQLVVKFHLFHSEAHFQGFNVVYVWI